MAWSKETRQARGYGAAWQKIRLTVLARDHHLCQCDECKKAKRLTVATEVHHIMSKAKAAKAGWTQDMIDHPSNLAAISHECHVRETMADKGHKKRPQIGIDGYPTDGAS